MQLSFKLLEKKIRDDKLFPLYIYKLKSSGESNIFHYHWHEEMEIIYCLFDGIVKIDGAEIPFHKNDMMFVNKNQLHLMDSLSKGNCFVIVFNYDFLSFEKNDFCQNNMIHSLQTGRIHFPNKVDMQSEIYREVHKNVTEIVDLYYSDVPGRELKIKSLLYDCIFLFYSKNQFITKTTQNRIHLLQQIDYIRTTIKYMEENFASAITIDDLAKNVNLSRFYLIKLFKQFTATTPIEYLINLRMENAAMLLSEQKPPITEIAYRVGFNNVNYFIRKFKERYATTPKKFARQSLSKD